MRRCLAAVIAAALLPVAVHAQSVAERLNDYPTAARADYIFACMEVNGRTRDVLMKCACSIDEVASILPFAQYEQAETVLSMRRVGGERMAMFNDSVMTNTMVAEMRRAQVEAELVCF